MSEQEQEGTTISVVDKLNPVLGATVEAQDMSKLNPILVPVGAFTDPHNPYTQSLSVNLPLDKAPLQHDAGYGADTQPEPLEGYENTMTAESETVTGEQPATLGDEALGGVIEERRTALNAMSREELDSTAEGLGLDPANYPNKSAIADAIVDAESA